MSRIHPKAIRAISTSSVQRRLLRPAHILALSTLCLAVSGCGAAKEAIGLGPERSAESFCDTYWEQKDAYLTKYADRAAETEALGQDDELLGVLAGLGSSIEALGDIVVIFDHLAETAPDDIRADVEAIRDSMQKSIDDAPEAASDPLAALAGGLMNGLTTMGSWERVGNYVVSNCGEEG